MKTKLTQPLVAALLGVAFTATLHAQSSAFTYQGSLTESGSPAGGMYDLRFTIYDADTGGTEVTGPVTNSLVAVSNGLFTVTLDFGAGVFNGSARWLEIGVATNGGGSFSILTPRQPITRAPYAVHASNIGSNALSAFSGPVYFSNPANSFSGTFSGDGSALSNLNVSTLGGLSASNFWQLGGNTGTTPGVNFLGTSDNQPLEIRVNNQRALRMEYTGTNTAPNLIGGVGANSIAVDSYGSVIAGGGQSPGYANTIGSNSHFSVIAGGVLNTIFSDSDQGTISGGFLGVIGPASLRSTIGGGVGNTIGVESDGSTIGGGDQNKLGDFTHGSTIGGGSGNLVLSNATSTTIAGGSNNQIGGGAGTSAIGGGSGNNISSDSFSSSIAAGQGNNIGVSSPKSVIGGGSLNSISSNSPGSTIAGGLSNAIDPAVEAGTIGGGEQGRIYLDTTHGTIAGGWLNTIGTNADYSTIGGGVNNFVAGQRAVIAGGSQNSATGNESTVGGGQANNATGVRATVAGGSGNVASFGGATVGGGTGNDALNTGATVAGGESNTAESYMSSVGGGIGNTASGSGSTVSGGSGNLAGTYYSTVGGGLQNLANANTVTVAGGQGNRATGNSTTVSGGQNNTNSGGYAMIPGGRENAVSGNYAFAAGYRAKANHNGSFVWADSTGVDFSSSGANQFLVRASGGIGLSGLVQLLQPIDDSAYGLRVDNMTQSGTLRHWVDGADKAHVDSGAAGTLDLILNQGGGYVGIGITNPSTALEVYGAVTAWSFESTSDRNLKENVTPVDGLATLAKVVAMPISQWNFKKDAETTHVGPMAQDFHAAFGLGTDDRHIATVDADGVALAAIQGLNQKLERENAKLRARLERLEQLLNDKLNGGVN